MFRKIKSYFSKPKKTYLCDACHDWGVIGTRTGLVCWYKVAGNIHASTIEPSKDSDWRYVDCPQKCGAVIGNL